MKISKLFIGAIILGFSIPALSFADVATSSRFVVPLNPDQGKVIQSLYDSGFIKDVQQFNSTFLTSTGSVYTIQPGGYKLTTGMNLSQVEVTLRAKPYMVWVVVPPGLRVEEVANLLTKNLNWTDKQKKNFLAYTNQNYNYIEGVYFPDSYLIPVDEDPKITYTRFISKFNENFSPLQKQLAQQNFPWLKALTLASLIQREAANKEEMPLIAGILLNRIDQKVKLGVDATIQYIRGDKGKGYWAPITVADKKIISKYNTYANYGLPPHPIDSPSLAAIKAVLNPAQTDCLYYLHDTSGTIHCSKTYDEHLQNIEVYLKGKATSTVNALPYFNGF